MRERVMRVNDAKNVEEAMLSKNTWGVTHIIYSYVRKRRLRLGESLHVSYS
jgi:hypothetical protein